MITQEQTRKMAIAMDLMLREDYNFEGEEKHVCPTCKESYTPKQGRMYCQLCAVKAKRERSRVYIAKIRAEK